jgi:hypothetical protein
MRRSPCNETLHAVQCTDTVELSCGRRWGMMGGDR